jgi:hypothetical protein
MERWSQLEEEHYRLARPVVPKRVNVIMNGLVVALAFNMEVNVFIKVRHSSQCIFLDPSHVAYF